MRTVSITITPELLGLIAEIDEFKGTWKSLGHLAPERLASLRRIATIESIGSSTRIEGSKLSDLEVEKLLGKISDASFATRDEQEVAGYANAMELIFSSHDEITVTENYVKQLHSLLLRHSIKDERHRGEYKKIGNSIEAFDESGKSVGVIIETASPFDTPLRMQELVHWTRETLMDRSWHPLIVIGVFAVTFLAIHPFQDGNGRLSRILTTLLLLKAGYAYVPYSSLESIIERNKESYYLALRRTQTTLGTEGEDFEPWLRFFLRSLRQQKEVLSRKIAVDPAMESLPIESQLILEHVRLARRITTSKAVLLTQAPRPTVKSRLADLVKRGLLVRNGKGRGAWYCLPQSVGSG